MVVPSPHQRVMKKIDAPMTAANESAVKSQRFQVTPSGSFGIRDA
jgi:hypothetical protein